MAPRCPAIHSPSSRIFAAQVAAKGIRRIEGHVYVDTSLMPDGEHEGGTGVTMSSIMVNDNIIDLSAKPAKRWATRWRWGVSPQTSYFHFVNAVTTGPAESKLLFDATDPAARPDGHGRSLCPAISPGQRATYPCLPDPSPTQFATAALQEALKAKGIEIKPKNSAALVKDFSSFQHFHTSEYQVGRACLPAIE